MCTVVVVPKPSISSSFYFVWFSLAMTFDRLDQRFCWRRRLHVGQGGPLHIYLEIPLNFALHDSSPQHKIKCWNFSRLFWRFFRAKRVIWDTTHTLLRYVVECIWLIWDTRENKTKKQKRGGYVCKIKIRHWNKAVLVDRGPRRTRFRASLEVPFTGLSIIILRVRDY